MIDEEKQEKLVEKAKEIFGTTDKCLRAGYILPDGELLDFGDPYRKGEDSSRYFDHSEVWQVYESFPDIPHIKRNGSCFATNFNDQFLLETGAIRLSNFYGEEIVGEMFQPHTPNRKQLASLEFCSCTLDPQHIIVELSKCDINGDYIPKNFSEKIADDCVEPINDLNKKIKKWKNERK